MAAADSLSERLARVREEIAAAAVEAGRNPAEVSLLPVTKGHPQAVVVAALEQGLDALGENYVQECHAKDLALTGAGHGRPNWHLLGHLQRNKVRLAAELFSLIETVDSLALARAISDARAGRPPLPILCEVDFTGLPGRRGYSPAQLGADLAALLALPGIRLQGLMTVAARDHPARDFGACRALRDELTRLGGVPLPVLSMGMSGDLREAVAAGSTQVRVGTLLFGPRG